MFDYQSIIDKYYPQGSALGVIYVNHCRSVAAMACAIQQQLNLPIPHHDVHAAAMLHDIGIYLCHAPSIHCHGTEPYLRHGLLGADLLRREGAPEEYARVCERHTGAGISPEEALKLNLPTDRTYLPHTLLERLICYADKFYSKSGSPERKPLPEVIASISRFGHEALARFMAMHTEFTKIS